jgi:hypothetical protein
MPLEHYTPLAYELTDFAAIKVSVVTATFTISVDSAWTDEITADCHHTQARNQFDPCGAICPHQATVA